MARQAGGFVGEILHCGAIRFRITGAGNFLSTLLSLGGVSQTALPPLTLQATTNREPVVLANFKDQRIQLMGQTDGKLDSTFLISRIVLFIQPGETSLPQ